MLLVSNAHVPGTSPHLRLSLRVRSRYIPVSQAQLPCMGWFPSEFTLLFIAVVDPSTAQTSCTAAVDQESPSRHLSRSGLLIFRPGNSIFYTASPDNGDSQIPPRKAQHLPRCFNIRTSLPSRRLWACEFCFFAPNVRIAHKSKGERDQERTVYY